MHLHRAWFGAAGIAALALVLTAQGPAATSLTPQKDAFFERRARLAAQSQTQHVKAPDANSLATGAFSVATPPPPSPGIAIGNTVHEAQPTSGYRVARLPGANCVHFAWVSLPRFPEPGSYPEVQIADYDISAGVTIQWYDPFLFGSNDSRPGWPSLDVDGQNLANIALHQRQDPAFPFHAWRIQLPVPCVYLHVDDELGGTGSRCTQTLWPQIAASRGGDSAVIHEIAIEDVNDCNNARVFYWRNTGGAWTGPVVIDSSDFISFVIADDPNSNNVAVVVQPIDGNPVPNVAYHESNTSGYGWLSGAELGPSSRHYITNYTDPAGAYAAPDLSTTYDNSGVLHVVFVRQQSYEGTEYTKVLHWNSQRKTLRTVDSYDYWGCGGNWYCQFHPRFAHVTVGIGDGSTMCWTGGPDEPNNNYVYVCYTKFLGETVAELSDTSANGYPNGELYLAVSNTGGNTWSPPQNLTNTKTPNCNPGVADTLTGIPARPDSVCRSEDWATIGRAVSDIDIFFISDMDAGDASLGEGTWQQNPVHYLRIPGGTLHANFICPVIAPVFEATLTSNPICEYHSARTGTDVESLEIFNLGNATLNGVVSVSDFSGAPTLTLSGGPGAYSIPAGNPNVVKTVTMAANNASEGLYSGAISITHNDATKSSPRVYPIDYFVVDDFHCANDLAMRTGVTSGSPGSLFLDVTSDARIAAQEYQGGLWRHSDSSLSIFDGSLLIAHGTQGPDTTVFLHFYNRATNGQNGFRALTDLVRDTSAYRTGAGNATATTYMCTKDSLVGIKMSWFFPQAETKDEYIIVQYKIYRNQPTVSITNLAIGVLLDEDVVPASRLGTVQSGAENQAAGDATRKLGYQIGVDTAGHLISPPSNTATRFRAGVATCGGWKGVRVGNNFDDIQPGGGPTDGFLYRQLTGLDGVNLFGDSTIDLYTLMSLDNGKSIAAGETLTYAVVFVSDTISESSFISTVDQALSAAVSLGSCEGGCPCAHEPHCDGVISDVLDVVEVINEAFRGDPLIGDPSCPAWRSDVDGSGAVDVLDVTKVINVAFRGMSVGSQYDLDPFLPGDQ